MRKVQFKLIQNDEILSIQNEATLLLGVRISTATWNLRLYQLIELLRAFIDKILCETHVQCVHLSLHAIALLLEFERGHVQFISDYTTINSLNHGPPCTPAGIPPCAHGLPGISSWKKKSRLNTHPLRLF